MKLEVRRSFCLIPLLAAALGVGDVLIWVALAAALHELGHLMALHLVGAAPTRLALSAMGAQLWADTRYLGYGREILCVLAGPAMNGALAALGGALGLHMWAGINAVQGLFNLLPIRGLDGERALRLTLSWVFGPYAADKAAAAVSLLSACALTGAALWVAARGGGAVLLMGAMGLLFPQLPLVKWGERR